MNSFGMSGNETRDIRMSNITTDNATSNTWRTPDNPVAVAIMSYGLPTVGFFGVIGNTLAFAVMVSKKMRGMSFSVYIAALAVVDMVNLARLIATQYFEDVIGFDMQGLLKFCNGRIWFYSGAMSASAWIVIAMTCERLIVICRPIESRMTFTAKRATIISCSLIAGAFLLYSPALLFFSYEVCGRPEGPTNDDPGLLDWPWYNRIGHLILSSATYSILPSPALIGLNTAIFTMLRKAVSANKHLSKNAAPHSKYNEVGRMVIAASVVYTVLTLPFVISNIYYRAIGEVAMRYKFKKPEQAFWILLLMLNHCINFAVYVLASRSFRQSLRAIFCPRASGPKTAKSVSETASSVVERASTLAPELEQGVELSVTI